MHDVRGWHELCQMSSGGQLHEGFREALEAAPTVIVHAGRTVRRKCSINSRRRHLYRILATILGVSRRGGSGSRRNRYITDGS